MMAKYDHDIWYGWSFFNENIGSYTRDKNVNLAIGQWKTGTDESSPQIFIKQVSRFESDIDVIVQLGDMLRSQNWGEEQNWGIICKLWKMEKHKGKWVDIVLNTNFGTNENGYLKIWVNDELRCDYKGRITASKNDSVPAPVHKRGLYGSYTFHFDNAHPNKKKPTFIAYYDEFRIGKSREAVDTRLIIARKGIPVD